MSTVLPAWFSFDKDERRDATKVAALEATAAKAMALSDFGTASTMIAEADEMRETWSQPRATFASFAEMNAELAALAEWSAELETLAALSAKLPDDGTIAGRYDLDALREIGERASSVGCALEELADDLEADREREA